MRPETFAERPIVRIQPLALRDYCERILVAAGASPENAQAAAEVHLEADLREFSGQGLDYIPRLVAHLRDHRVDGKARLLISADSAGQPGEPLSATGPA